jgi:hypothetical protein
MENHGKMIRTWWKTMETPLVSFRKMMGKYEEYVIRKWWMCSYLCHVDLLEEFMRICGNEMRCNRKSGCRPVDVLGLELTRDACFSDHARDVDEQKRG